MPDHSFYGFATLTLNNDGCLMKRSRSFLAIAGVIGIGLCALVYRSVRISVETPAETGTTGTRQLADNAMVPEPSTLAEMRQEIAQLKHQVWAQGQWLSPADSAKAQPPPAAQPPASEARAEQERKRRDYMAGVEDTFRKETRDPQWSSATSATVRTALASDDDLRPLARGVECRSQTCRVEIADDGSGKLGKILPMFAQRIGQDLPSITADRVEGASGAGTVVLYMSRHIETAVAP